MGRAILESALIDSRIRVAGVVVRRPPEVALPGAPVTYLDLSKALDARNNPAARTSAICAATFGFR